MQVNQCHPCLRHPPTLPAARPPIPSWILYPATSLNASGWRSVAQRVCAIDATVVNDVLQTFCDEFVKDNPHMFLTSKWVKEASLKAFMAREGSMPPSRSPSCSATDLDISHVDQFDRGTPGASTSASTSTGQNSLKRSRMRVKLEDEDAVLFSSPEIRPSVRMRTCWDSAQGEEVNEIMDSDDEVEWDRFVLLHCIRVFVTDLN